MAFVVNSIDFFVSHRIAIGLRLLSLGYEVHLIAPGPCPEEIINQGFRYHAVSISRDGKGPLGELLTVYELYRLFKKIKPSVVHLVTIKPYLYGGIAARLAGVASVVSAVAGLGILFSQNSFKSRLLRIALYPLYKIAFGHHNQRVIFQNLDDMQILEKFAGLDPKKSILIRGAGVDLQKYTFKDEPVGVPVISLASRLLKDKGIVEFVEASRILRLRGVKAEFRLIGTPDLGNANTVTPNQLDGWQCAGLVKCLGYRKDIAQLFGESNIVTLPSYYGEGLPKVLIEAAACGRAVITTDHPGCRDAVKVGETALLIPIKDSEALANAIETLIGNPTLRARLGMSGRQLAEEVFDIQKVIDSHVKIYEGLIAAYKSASA